MLQQLRVDPGLNVTPEAEIISSNKTATTSLHKDKVYIICYLTNISDNDYIFI